MKTSVIGNQSFQSLKIELEPGEFCSSEAGKMVRCSSNVGIEVHVQKNGGGLLGGLKRLLSGNSFFSSVYTANGGGAAEVVVAPTLMGQVRVVDLRGDSTWICAGGSYLASGPEIKSEARWHGAGGAFLAGESLLYLHCQGVGFLAVESFGTITEVDVNGSFVVDTGHVVAFQDSLKFKISKVGGSWMTSFLSGEGFVLNFEGSGKLLIQSHNGGGFGSTVGPLLAPRRG